MYAVVATGVLFFFFVLVAPSSLSPLSYQAVMSLRSESIKVFRDLYKASANAAVQCSLHNQSGLLRYVSSRFASAAETHRRRLSSVLQELASAEDEVARLSRGRARQQQLKSVARRRKRILQEYETFTSQQIDYTRSVAQALPYAADSAAHVSLLQVLAAGIGSEAYQQLMESSFMALLEFQQKQEERNEVVEEATSERQNRIMQQAVLPYAERLLLVHRTAIGEYNPASNLLYLSPWQVSEAIAGTRSGVTAHHLQHGREHVVVEIDEVYNKQVIYIACTREDGSDSGSYNWEQEVERVEISESEEVQRTLFHSEFLYTGVRLCDALQRETPLHPTRKTVVVGHGVGGAVALVVSLHLHQRGFEVSNTITLGAPKAIQGTRERYVAAVNPVRIVLAGDPLVELPVTGAEGAPFVHVGEILILSPQSSNTDSNGTKDGGEEEDSRHSAAASSPLNQQDVSAENLMDLLNEPQQPGAFDTLGTSPEEGGATTTAAERDVSGDDADGDDDLPEALRVAAQRYKEGFLVEHYVQHLSNPAVELTYAEGDEVWDNGDLEAMKEGYRFGRASSDGDLRGDAAFGSL